MVVNGKVQEKRRGAQATHAVAAFMNKFPGKYQNTRLVQLVGYSWDFEKKLAEIGSKASLGIWSEPDEGYIITSYAFLSNGACKAVSQYKLI